jgi:hypothetical protein
LRGMEAPPLHDDALHAPLLQHGSAVAMAAQAMDVSGASAGRRASSDEPPSAAAVARAADAAVDDDDVFLSLDAAIPRPPSSDANVSGAVARQPLRLCVCRCPPPHRCCASPRVGARDAFRRA